MTHQGPSHSKEISILKEQLAKARKRCIGLENQISEQKSEFKWERKHAKHSLDFWKNSYGRLFKLIEDEFSCYICLDICIEATVLGCGHAVCAFCWAQFNKLANTKLLPTCPHCRASIFIHSKQVALIGFLDQVFDLMPSQIKEKRQKQIQERKVEEEAAELASKSQIPTASDFSAVPTVLRQTGETGVEFVYVYPSTPNSEVQTSNLHELQNYTGN